MNMTTVPSNQLKAMQHEIADLKEQITNAKYNYLGAMADCKQYEETITQQAEAIRLKDVVFEKIACIGNGDTHGNSIGNCLAIDALAIQPSPEILQARDVQVAEACAKVCIEQAEGIARSTPVSRDRVHTMFKGIARPAPVIDCSESSVREAALRIRNGAWERHL